MLGRKKIVFLQSIEATPKIPNLPTMNIEDYRAFCLSLGSDVEERMPFQTFKAANGVLVFYVGGHMFSLFDINSFSIISLKCQTERIAELKERYPAISNPYNMSVRHWIGIDPYLASNELLCELTRNSYLLVRSQKPRKSAPKTQKVPSNVFLQFGNRSELRILLKQHHASESECWVVTYRSKAAPSYPAVSYRDLVEEALCFGWIDSVQQRLEDGKLIQRISPRRKNSSWSRLNIERFLSLQEQGLTTPAGEKAFKDGKHKLT